MLFCSTASAGAEAQSECSETGLWKVVCGAQMCIERVTGPQHQAVGSKGVVVGAGDT